MGKTNTKKNLTKKEKGFIFFVWFSVHTHIYIELISESDVMTVGAQDDMHQVISFPIILIIISKGVQFYEIW